MRLLQGALPNPRTDLPPQKKGGQKFWPPARKVLAEVHGNRTHLPPYSEGTPDLKSGGPTSEPGTSSGILSRSLHAFPVFPRGLTMRSPWPAIPPAWPTEYITGSNQSKTPEGVRLGVETSAKSNFVIRSEANDLVFPCIYEILRSLRSLRMTKVGTLPSSFGSNFRKYSSRAAAAAPPLLAGPSLPHRRPG
jgi:hypothetical protein